MITTILLTALTATTMIKESSIYDNFDNARENEISDSIYNLKESKQEPGRLIDQDSFEPNNSLSESAFLYYENYYLVESYQKNINATLDCEMGVVDCDYFYFNILTDSDIEIDVQTIDSYSFDFIVSKYEYYFDNSHPEQASHDIDDIYSDFSTNQSKYFSDVLTPGTYFIYLRGQQPSNSYYTIHYDLELNVSKSSDGYDRFSVGEMKYSKGLPGAVWISDYVPCGIFPFSSNENFYNYFSSSQLIDPNIRYDDYSLNALKDIATNDEIRVATVYIWNSELKYVLYQTFSTLKNIIEQQLSNYQIIESNIEIVSDVISGTLNIVGTIAGVIINNPVASVAVSLLTDVTADLINHYLKFLIPKYPINLVDYVDALDILISELLIYDINGQPMTTQSGAMAINNSGVFIFPIYYKIFYTNGAINYHKFSYLQTFEHIASLNNPHTALFNNDYHTKINTTSLSDYCYCRGKLYAIDCDVLSFEDLTLVSNVPNIDPIVHSWPIDSYGDISGSNMDAYEYRWYDLYTTVPGTYYFAFKFETDDQMDDIVIEQFNSSFGGYTQNPIATFTKNYTQTSGGINRWVIYFNKTFAAGEHMYIRLRGDNYHPTNSFYALAGTNQNTIMNGLVHISHNYDTYTWLNYNQHQALCSECGHQTTQPHAVSANAVPFHGYYTCLLCGGLASRGILGQSLNSSLIIAVTDNGSVQLADGLLIIVDDDLYDLYHDCLIFHDLSLGIE